MNRKGDKSMPIDAASAKCGSCIWYKYRLKNGLAQEGWTIRRGKAERFDGDRPTGESEYRNVRWGIQFGRYFFGVTRS